MKQWWLLFIAFTATIMWMFHLHTLNNPAIMQSDNILINSEVQSPIQPVITTTTTPTATTNISSELKSEPIRWGTIFKHHMYNSTLLAAKMADKQCENFYSSPENITFHLEGMNFWSIPYERKSLGKQRAMNEEYYPVLFGTERVQRLLYEINNPKNCTNAKYALFSLGTSGIGSEIHQMSLSFAVAVHFRRIAVFPTTAWANGAFCDAEKSWSCYFRSLSEKCSPSQDDLRSRASWNHDFSNDMTNPVIDVSPDGGTLRTYVPHQVVEILKCAPIDEMHYYFYWRIQAATYMVRPNAKAMAEILKLREQYFNGPAVMPAGAFNFHVRHGDKHMEMALYNLDHFIKIARNIVAENNKAKNIVFLSTEDPKVIEESKNISDFTFYYSTEKRENLPLGGLLSQGAPRVLLDLLNLYISLECDAHLATFGSNWNRLIEELKGTIGFCAGCPLVSVDEKCSSVEECRQKGLVRDYNW